MKEISATELKQKLDQQESIVLLDVREPAEVDTASIGGVNIPMGEVISRISEIDTDKEVVVICRSGQRAGNILKYLEMNHGFENLVLLSGGLLAWADEVDPTLPIC